MICLRLLHFSLMCSAGMGEAEVAGIPWRLGGDLDLVVHNKKVMAAASLLHSFVVEKGLAEVDIMDHSLASRFHEVP